ncbi:hypothetical protein [Streptomyces calidiresistens]|uniref:Uncharacterized protein n=1 Tax=Streptomyces calidiresistens TaxID=1485586 RepID=A0A7W3T7N4_9ACTN|nr:hypothetical protein [Streptomyces calidiresistens]MBB0232439.1 hypothetical protein [Streptomyces calidiresistens]
MPAEYDPERAALFSEYRQVRQRERELLPKIKEAAIEEMRRGATIGQLSADTGLNREVFRRLAREHDLERLRPPTVRAIKEQADETPES